MKEKRIINERNINPHEEFVPKTKDVPGIIEVINIINESIIPNIHTIYGNIDELIESNKKMQNTINEYILTTNAINNTVSQNIGERLRDKNEYNILFSQLNSNIVQCYNILNKLPEMIITLIEENFERIIEENINEKFSQFVEIREDDDEPTLENNDEKSDND